MKRFLFVVIGVGLLVYASRTAAQEVLTLTSPIVLGNTTTCTLESFFIYPSIANAANGRIVVTLKGTNGETFVKEYNAGTNPTGASQISLLNTANNSSTSLIKRIYQRLSTDGVCVGSVTGSPQH